MLDGTSLSEPASALQRAQGRVSVALAGTDGRPRLVRAFQSGAAKVRFPRVHGHDRVEAVQINTAGGLTGGDRFEASYDLHGGAAAILTSQAAEKVYRSSGGAATVSTTLTLGAGTRAAWVPQETILFDRARMRRDLTLDAEIGAEWLVIEPVVFGRSAMGEVVRQGSFKDSWRVRVGGHLVFAEEARIEGEIEPALHGPSVGEGATAFATLLFAGPDLAGRRDALRAAHCPEGLAAGVGIVRGLLTARLAARDPSAQRGWIVDAFQRLTGCPPPVAWRC